MLSGRRSEPFSMDMNLHGVRGENGKVPEIVLFQYDQTKVMNPRGLLVAYAEQKVRPVVSDFDTFTVASKGMRYEPMPEDQAQLIKWCLEHTEQVMSTPDHQNWTSRWIEVLRRENERGFHPHLPLYGFGDPTSYEMISRVVKATQVCGAVRHGAECFNFYFPQELDDEFLVVWNEFKEKPWAYFTESALREFLIERITKDGFACPINAVWAVRDRGWHKVLEALRNSAEGQKVFPSWYLPHMKIHERIDELRERFPDCFKQQAEEGMGARKTDSSKAKAPKLSSLQAPSLAMDFPTTAPPDDSPSKWGNKRNGAPTTPRTSACTVM
eukprot:TRINITY_DN14595_c2_g3_i2.p1 TRINITY_DN14595_c2_g3~~TRINITY_DN14595_c2_g3_i2.p1  ORF type:complete len:327 (-),score=64.84 TRINITY_DN14595_c2_g3_i2:167-1147(-)